MGASEKDFLKHSQKEPSKAQTAEDKVTHEGHRKRLKNRFLTSGLDSFEPHNILELLLFYSIPRKDTNETAHLLLKRFGSLSAVFDAPFSELIKVKGISESSATLIKLIPALSRAYLSDKAKHTKEIDSPEKAASVLIPRFVGEMSEVLLVLALDNKGMLKKIIEISRGSVSCTDINMRLMVQELLARNASAAIIAHNHPNGFAVPSKQDFEATRQISKTLQAMDINLLDHIIISGEEFFSMSQNLKYASAFTNGDIAYG